MNQLTIIGNLTRDPEIRDTNSGKSVATFTVAVNRRSSGDHPEADFFRVSAWDQLGELCYKYLAKGRKVAVVGRVGAHGYKDNRGDVRASLEVTASSVEFLTPKNQQAGPPEDDGRAWESGITPPDRNPPAADPEDDDEELPF